MLRRWFLGIGVMLLMAVSLSCSRATAPVATLPPAPEETGDGWLTIRTEQVEYPVGGDPFGGEYSATVVNLTDRMFYARLGDGFNTAAEQATLWAAEGSHGSVEEWDGNSWDRLPRAFLIEGVRIVELHPRSTYTLRGHFDSASDRFDRSPDRISLRFRVQYFDDAATSPEQAHQDFSNIFVLKR
jgi:hypothetical protein